MNGFCTFGSIILQISRASLVPKSSYIAKPAASWLDDFLVWMSPEAFSCCRKFTNGSYCPPDDQVRASFMLDKIWMQRVQLLFSPIYYFELIFMHNVYMLCDIVVPLFLRLCFCF